MEVGRKTGLCPFAIIVIDAYCRAVVLFIVHEGEGNFADIRQLQYQISELNHTVQVNYAGFATLNECARLDSNNKLFV